MLLSGLSALGMNIFLPSLPTMAAYFETEYRVVQLSVALYLGMNAVLQVVIGPISDFTGRRPVILTAIALFMLATLGCIHAPTIEVFLGFRMAQAVIVACMSVGRASIRDMMGPAESAKWISYVTMAMSISPMIAPALGGFLEEAFGWKGAFWALFLAAAVMFWITWRDMGETLRKEPSFRLRDQIREYPELLVSHRFWGYALSAAFGSGAFFAYLGGAPYVGTEIFRLEPSVLGMWFGAPAVGYMIGNGLSGRFTMSVGMNRMMAFGVVATTTGTFLSLLIFLVGHGSPAVFFGMMSLVALGNGLVIPNATAGMLSVRPKLAGSASGLGGAIMIGGGAALSAFSGTVLTPGSGATPLLWIMFGSSVAAVGSVAYVLLRARYLVRRGQPEI